MKLNKVVSTLEMPHEEWLRYRKKGIGGSDAGAICGVNCVYGNDEFEYELGLNPKLVHKPAARDRGELLLVYAF